MAEIPFSNEELKEAASGVIEELRPMLQMDGGDA
jgi:Fe-S cluster biogenesis protein NfuA